MDVFSTLTGLASIVGCGISIWQARKSKKSADKAEEYKKTVFNRMLVLDISDVIQKLTEVELMLKEYQRFDKSGGTPQGRTRGKDVKVFDEAFSLLNKKIPIIPKDIRSKVEKCYEQVSKSEMLKDTSSILDNTSRIIRYLSVCHKTNMFE